MLKKRKNRAWSQACWEDGLMKKCLMRCPLLLTGPVLHLWESEVGDEVGCSGWGSPALWSCGAKSNHWTHHWKGGTECECLGISLGNITFVVCCERGSVISSCIWISSHLILLQQGVLSPYGAFWAVFVGEKSFQNIWLYRGVTCAQTFIPQKKKERSRL